MHLSLIEICRIPCGIGVKGAVGRGLGWTRRHPTVLSQIVKSNTCEADTSAVEHRSGVGCQTAGLFAMHAAIRVEGEPCRRESDKTTQVTGTGNTQDRQAARERDLSQRQVARNRARGRVGDRSPSRGGSAFHSFGRACLTACDRERYQYRRKASHHLVQTRVTGERFS